MPAPAAEPPTTEQVQKLLVDALNGKDVTNVQLQYVGRGHYRGTAMLRGTMPLSIEATAGAQELRYAIRSAAPAPAQGSLEQVLSFDVNGCVPWSK